jgi:hypothetical protein
MVFSVCRKYAAPFDAKVPRIFHPIDRVDRRINREIRFKFQQDRTHEWVRFRDVIALWGDTAVTYLKADLAAGRLGWVVCIHKDWPLHWVRPGGAVLIRPEGRGEFEHCWMQRAVFLEWCARWSFPCDAAADFAGEIEPVTALEALTVPVIEPVKRLRRPGPPLGFFSKPRLAVPRAFHGAPQA